MVRVIAFLGLLMAAVANTPAIAEVVEYEFDINYKVVNFTGSPRTALAIADSIPAPTVRAKVGDILRVTFRNRLEHEASIHWHGVLLPPDQDGVPYLNTTPIPAQGEHTFEYPVIHDGTFWYHSHTGLDEQLGLYGGIVFESKIPSSQPVADHDYVVVLSDWIDEKPTKVLNNLKKDSDFYAIKKGSTQSWLGRLQNGRQAVVNHLRRAWMRMRDIDLSDIAYDAFLANGKRRQELMAAAGDTVRLRLINGSASSYFIVEFAGGEMTVISADGNDVAPYSAKRLKIATAETYDVLVKIPADRAYELRANVIDGSGYSSTFIGKGEAVAAADYPKPNYYLLRMRHDSHESHETRESRKGHGGKHWGASMAAMEASEYKLLRAPKPSEIGGDLREIILRLTGDMERYIWSFNNKILSEADKILIRKGERVRLILVNETMMDHPLHLHGHFFRVLNGQGDHSPWKHTINVPARQTVAIEFAASEERDWFFHCHNLYHLASGMARIIAYQDTTLADEETARNLGKEIGWFPAIRKAWLSNMTYGYVTVERERHLFKIEYDYGWEEKGFEVDTLYEHNLDRLSSIYGGGNFQRDGEGEETDEYAVVGVTYLLPLLVEVDLRLDNFREWEAEFSSEHQLTERLEFEWRWRYELRDRVDDYRMDLAYELSKTIAIVATYDSDFKSGVGIRLWF